MYKERFVNEDAHPKERRRLSSWIAFGNLEGAARIGRDKNQKAGIDCVQSDIRAFDTAVDWNVTALELGG